MADAVVIGAGPNGLVAANLLADAGWEVEVLEAEPEPGGAVRSGEITLPGYVHDRFSSFYPLAAASPVLKSLELESHGLRWCRSPLPVAHPTRDGTVAYVDPDIDATAAALEALGVGDGAAWRRFQERWGRVGAILLDALFTPFPPVAPGARIAAALGPRGTLDFARFGMLTLRRWAREELSGDGAARLVAGNALHADLSPEQPGSLMYGWVLCGLAQTVGFPVPEGGSGQLTAALVRRLESRGGRLTCGARVDRILLRRRRAVGVRTADGREVEARRAVLADVAVARLLLDLVGRDALPGHVLAGLKRIEHGPGTVKVDWALDGPVPWLSEPTSAAGTVHVGEGLDGLSQYAHELAVGQVPREPFVIAGQYSRADPTRMPEGHEVVWGYSHVPQEVRGDAGDEGLTGRWDAGELERMADRIEDQIEAVAPGFRGRVLARTINGPRELEAMDANLVGGDLNGGTAQLHQQLVFRPVPGLGRAETAIPGLYLASASAHPGGGVHGACGAIAARAALRERGLAQRAMAGIARRVTGAA